MCRNYLNGFSQLTLEFFLGREFECFMAAYRLNTNCIIKNASRTYFYRYTLIAMRSDSKQLAKTAIFVKLLLAILRKGIDS